MSRAAIIPRFDVNPNTGDPLGDYRRMVPADNTIYHDADHPSQVILPVIDGARTCDQSIATPGTARRRPG